MEAKRYSKEELWALRNEVSIKGLMEALEVPVKMQEGLFRFLCPSCGEFETGVKVETNLGRCFRCDKNYNPIEIVMATKGYSFVSSVRYLSELRKNREKIQEVVSNVVSTLR
jgi:DNA primase